MRDTTAAVEVTNQTVCLVSLDVKVAFDRVKHEYLWYILRAHGINTESTDLLTAFYRRATSRCQADGHASAAFPICSSIRQGYPLSAILFTLVINLSLWEIENELRVFSLEEGTQKVKCVTYADDVILLITDKWDIAKLKNILAIYEQASGATLNRNKSGFP